MTISELEEALGPEDGIGLLLGVPSNGLIDIDIDCPEAAAIAGVFLPSTGRIHGRKSKPDSHRWFRTTPIPATEQFADPDGTMLVELRSTGSQTVIPPSFHPSGEQFRWKLAGAPSFVECDELRRAVRRLVSCALLARNWPEPGQRHECSKALAGMLLRAGWPEDEAVKFLEIAAKVSGRDEEWQARKGDVQTTVKRLSEGRAATGIPRLKEILGDKVVDKLVDWLGLSSGYQVVGQITGAFPAGFVQWPEPLKKEALYGLPGEIVSAIEPYSEADPAALLVQGLVSYGNAIGRQSFFKVESDRHFTNLFATLVGETAKARKGISWTHIRNLFKEAAPEWAELCIQKGLSTGEGLIQAVRDPVVRRKQSEGDSDPDDIEYVTVDEGVSEKRLLAQEAEFAQVLKLMARETNILSTIVRQAWDGEVLKTMTKTNPGTATGAHISIVGHVTQDELRRHLTETEQANGFGNRFLWVCVRRSKVLPRGGQVPEEVLTRLARKLENALKHADSVKEMRRSKKATKLWCDVYGELSEGKPGMLGALTSRAEAQTMRLAMVYALMDLSPLIRTEHLRAALALWSYVEASTRFIFGEALGDSLADEILTALRESPNGMTRTEISNLFQRHRSSAQIVSALRVLARHGRAVYRREQTDGRPDERWFVPTAGAKNAKKD